MTRDERRIKNFFKRITFQTSLSDSDDYISEAFSSEGARHTVCGEFLRRGARSSAPGRRETSALKGARACVCRETDVSILDLSFLRGAAPPRRRGETPGTAGSYFSAKTADDEPLGPGEKISLSLSLRNCRSDLENAESLDPAKNDEFGIERFVCSLCIALCDEMLATCCFR